MTDPYANIRKALDAYDTASARGHKHKRGLAYLDFRDACDPDTIRELLAERDALAQENEAMRRCAIKYLTWLDAVSRPPEDVLREDMANPDMCGDAAIAAASGGTDG